MPEHRDEPLAHVRAFARITDRLITLPEQIFRRAVGCHQSCEHFPDFRKAGLLMQCKRYHVQGSGKLATPLCNRLGEQTDCSNMTDSI